MALGFYKQYQEIFKDIAVYYDLSSRGIIGTTVNNIATPGTNAGTLVGSSWTFADTDRFGIAKNSNANFTISNYVSCPLLLNFASGTIMMWFKRTISGSHDCLFGIYKMSSISSIQVIIYSTTNKMSFEITSGGADYMLGSTMGAISNDIWYCGVVTWGVGGMKLYKFNQSAFVDKESNAISAYANTIAHPFGIGVFWIPEQPVISHPFAGNIGDVMVWKDRQLSEPEIYALWNLTKNKYLYPVLSGTRMVE